MNNYFAKIRKGLIITYNGQPVCRYNLCICPLRRNPLHRRVYIHM